MALPVAALAGTASADTEDMTFPTKMDLEFFESKRVPRWALPLLARPVAQSSIIDIVVNAHAGYRTTPGECAASNLLEIVRSHRRRGLDVERYLAQIAVEPGCLINPEKRSAFARKWASRLQGG